MLSPFGIMPLPTQLPTHLPLNFRMPPTSPPTPIKTPPVNVPTMKPQDAPPFTPMAPPQTGSPQPPEGYSLVSAADADRLLTMLRNGTGDFKRKREEHVARQREARNWKADFVTEEECLEVAGEISPEFQEAVERLGIFQDEVDCNIMYKKVPTTSMQQKNKKHHREEDLRFLFTRWMQIDSESIQLLSQEFNSQKFKVWTSLRYMNLHGSYCEVFVISSPFNRHLFHKELLS